MDKEKIISFIKQNRGAEIAELQKKFDVSYKAVKDIIDWLVTVGDLAYAEGVRYNYIDKPEILRDGRRSDFRRDTVEAFKKHEDIANEESEERPKYKSLREYFEMRRKEFEQRDEDREENNDDDNEVTLDDDEMDEDELRHRALKLCIERGTASVSMFQRAFPIGYIRACHLVDWMEEQGYISAQSQGSRKVLITEEEYDNLYPFDCLDADEDDLEEDDKRLSSIIDSLHFADDSVNRNSAHISSEEQKPAIQGLVNILSRIAERKKEPVSADVVPGHNLWVNDDEFAKAVIERMKALIRSDKKMGKQGAVRKAETYLEAVRDTHDGRMVQVYERIVYEIKTTSNYLYAQLKKQLFED